MANRSLGWLTESTIMPRKSRKIEEVSNASMVGLHAALYQSEESLRNPDAVPKKRRHEASNLLKGAHNSGVKERDAKDEYDRDEARLISEALARKAELYDRMSSGKASVDARSEGLVDFELKQLTAPEPGSGTGDLRTVAPLQFAPPPPPGTEHADAARLAWERAAHEEMCKGVAAQPSSVREEMAAREASAAQRRWRRRRG